MSEKTKEILGIVGLSIASGAGALVMEHGGKWVISKIKKNIPKSEEAPICSDMETK